MVYNNILPTPYNNQVLNDCIKVLYFKIYNALKTFRDLIKKFFTKCYKIFCFCINLEPLKK